METESGYQETVVDVTGLAHGGDGVCRLEGQVCFVPHALPGDRIRVRVTRRAKQVLWGAIEELVEPSPDRIAPCCPKFGECGGCSWLHFAYPAQAHWKCRILSDCLARIAGIEAEPEWVEDPALRLGYRTRAQLHGHNGRLGFYASGSHEVVDIERCPLFHETLNAAFERLRGVGVEGTVEVVTNPLGDDVLLWSQRPSPALKEAFPQAGWRGLRGPRASFVFDGKPVVNGAFCQSSLLLNRLLVQTVHECIGAPQTLLDLYCGNGNLSLGLAPEVHVVGLDQNRAAVNAATGLGPGDYRPADETAFAEAIGAKPWDAILLDPPRTGAKAIAPALTQSAAGSIVYVSCDPATLARDLKTLAQEGWRVQRLIAIDLFPHTAHIETVCRLER